MLFSMESGPGARSRNSGPRRLERADLLQVLEHYIRGDAPPLPVVDALGVPPVGGDAEKLGKGLIATGGDYEQS